MQKLFNLALVFVLLLFSFPSIGFSSSAVVAQRGMNSEKVGQIQSMLWELKLYDSEIDQDFGSITEQAVRRFQNKLKKPQDGIVTKELESLLAKESGLDFTQFKRQMLMDVTAYSSQDPGCSGTTATGIALHKGIVAVDPSVIPLGTKIYVPGYGKAVAADVGGGIRNNILDIAYDYRSEALQFGRRTLLVYIM